MRAFVYVQARSEQQGQLGTSTLSHLTGFTCYETDCQWAIISIVLAEVHPSWSRIQCLQLSGIRDHLGSKYIDRICLLLLKYCWVRNKGLSTGCALGVR
jgi:hypothetical protein